jgi:aminopeptidase N
MKAGIDKLKNIGMTQTGSPWRRLAATKAIHEMREALKASGEDAAKVTMLKTIIDGIKAAETVPDLVQIYQQYGG